MSLADFAARIRHAEMACGLNHLSLECIDIDLGSLQRAAGETFSREGLRSLGVTTMRALAVSSVVDGLLETQGIDLLHGSLFDLVTPCFDHAAQTSDLAAGITEQGGDLVDVAGHAGGLAGTLMHVATGGLTLFTSMAASHLVGRYVQAKKDERQALLACYLTEGVRRESFLALKQALGTPGCTPAELAEPVLLLLKAGDSPAVLVSEAAP